MDKHIVRAYLDEKYLWDAKQNAKCNGISLNDYISVVYYIIAREGTIPAELSIECPYQNNTTRICASVNIDIYNAASVVLSEASLTDSDFVRIIAYYISFYNRFPLSPLEYRKKYLRRQKGFLNCK